MGENWVGGGRLSNVGGAYLFFLHSLMGIFFFFLQGPRPPQAIMWLRPWKQALGACGKCMKSLFLAREVRVRYG